MRDIKFRAWDGSEMFYDDIYCNDSTSSCYIGLDGKIRENGNLLERDDLFTLMQYTGLKDENGKELYEGDIVYIAGLGNSEVIFSFGQFIFKNNNGLWRDYTDIVSEKDMGEIKGNIYENPELLANIN